MIRLIGYATTFTVLGNTAANQDTDFRPFVSGRWNSNFMRLRVGGFDRNLFGPWMPLARAIVLTVKGAVEVATGNFTEGLGDVAGVYRGFASGSVGNLWDQISGEDAIGRDVRSSKQVFGEWLVSQHLPFSFGDVGTAISQVAGGVAARDPVAAAAGAVNATASFEGLSAAPLSVTDKVAQGKYGEMRGLEQQGAIPAEAWRRITPVAGDAVKGYATYSQWRKAQVRALSREFVILGLPVSLAALKAEETVEKNPIARGYSKVKNQLESRWVLENPKAANDLLEAESKLPWYEHRFNPTQAERAAIGAAR